MNLNVVLSLLGLPHRLNSCELQNVSIDSRQIKNGDLFLAVPGEKVDGRDYIQQAITNGAAALLVQSPFDSASDVTTIPIIIVPDLKTQVAHIASSFYEYPAHELKLIGVTGTNGKTSTSHYIAQILNAAQLHCGVMGTIGNGLLNQLQTSQLTTSDSCTVQRQLFDLKNAAVKYVAMEVSSHALTQDRLAGLTFETVIFTNLSQDHLDYHKDMQDYFNAKAKLFYAYQAKHAVINIDDPYAEQLLKVTYADIKVITYSLLNPQADIYLNNNNISTPWGETTFQTTLIGKFNQSNVLASIATCCLQGLSLETVMHAVKNLTAVPGRMQKVLTQDSDVPQVIVDYAHTPDAVIKALQALREYTHGTLYCIVGCGGDRDRSKRPLMLRAALENSDVVIITQDNPRTEDPQQIVNDMLQDVATDAKYTIELDRTRAITNTIAQATERDLILIAGKGHEDYQIIGNQKLPFSDLSVAEQAITNRSKSTWVV